MCTRI